MVIRTKNKLLQIRWARVCKNWALDTWKNFCFSDECSVVIGKDSRMYCWRWEDEKDAPYLVCPPIKRLVSYNGLGSGNVWRPKNAEMGHREH